MARDNKAVCTMKRRRLGSSELSIGPLVFGGNVFGWTVDEKAGFDLLDAFIAGGFNMIDTADTYVRWVPGAKGGESETIIGAWMKARRNRDKVVIATKVGMEMGPREKGLSRRWITAAVEDSLKRLQTDYIDLYQAHTDDTAVSQDETAEAFDGLVKAGKVRVLGASNFSGERLRSALHLSETRGLPRYQTLQPHYNLYERASFESDAQPVCVEAGVSVIPYFPLASGFLSGKYRSQADLSKSPRGGGMSKFMNPRGFRILDALDGVAKRMAATPARVALAWLMQRPAIAAPIASATTRAQVDDLVKAAELTLDAPAIEALDRASAR
jgi:aryl-alcohol dehydrogenase-like predicted oxidoreductase